jgi:hypothetical protein
MEQIPERVSPLDTEMTHITLRNTVGTKESSLLLVENIEFLFDKDTFSGLS